MKINALIHKKTHFLILIMILLIALFFRSYQAVERLEFAHDNDLYSWIVKDVVVNHHPRLIGQLTSAPGIFIGPLFYYLLVPFFLLANMDPASGIIPVTILALLNVLSYYFVFSKLFNKPVGLIAAFLQAVLLSLVQFDRAVVPSTPTNLWMIWYFYSLISIMRKDYRVLPIVGILIGLIWHIHVALAPALIALPVAVLFARKLPTRKQLFWFIFSLVVTSLPLIIFETRHGFSQTYNFIQNFAINHGGEKGLPKLVLLLDKLVRNVNYLLFTPQHFALTYNLYFVAALFLSPLLLIKQKILKWSELIVLYSWIVGVVIFFTFSSVVVSEYYLTNIEVIIIAIVSLLLYSLYRLSVLGKLAVVILLAIVLVKNLIFFIPDTHYKKGYVERKGLAAAITQDAKEKGYPCISVSYITSPGENVGFRYFFYLNNVKMAHPSLDVPVYNIVLPEELATVDQKFGHIGLIYPRDLPSQETINQNCQGENTNLTDPMFGYVE